jgi:predicted deacylase
VNRVHFWLIAALFAASCTSQPIVVAEIPVVNVTTAVTTPSTPINLTTIPATFTAVPPFANNTRQTPISTPSMTPPPTQTPQPTPTLQLPFGFRRTIGYSVQNRPINSYQFGDGPITILFVGGIHGGYEWNTILLAYELIDYIVAHPEFVPDEVTLFIIPSANPDGQYLITNHSGRFAVTDVPAATTSGRFNANTVDLNRNWDCQWSSAARWQNEIVAGGTEPFSEPETQALRDFIGEWEPTAVLFWHSAANGIFPGDCGQPFAPSVALANVFGDAAGYPVRANFTSYPVTGDASDWLATQGIASVTVELKTHDALDWEKNLAGVTAVLQHNTTAPQN